MKPLSALAALVILLASAAASAASPVTIVAAENFYGDVAQQIGGSQTQVTSILGNPDQDPHLFEVTPSVARAVSHARIVVYNGVGYDTWMRRLLQATRRPGRTVIVVGKLAHRLPGDNPHVWYDTAVMLRFATTLTGDLSRIDPAHAADYQHRLAAFRRSMQPVQARIAALRATLAGTPVTATEPVFGYMLEALGMQVRDLDFQIAMMNGTEPSARNVAGFEDDIRRHRVHLLIYNEQAYDPMARHMVALAQASHVPVVRVTETEPPGKTYQAWMLAELDAVARALAH